MSDAQRGWSSGDLMIVDELDPRWWSVSDAARLLGPPTLTEAEVRHLLRLAGVQPVGKRPNGARRRHVRVYDAAAVLDAHSRVAVR